MTVLEADCDGAATCRIHRTTFLRFGTDGNGHLLESCADCEREQRRRRLMERRITLAELPATLMAMRGNRTHQAFAHALGIPGKAAGTSLRNLEAGAKPRGKTVDRLKAAGVVITDLYTHGGAAKAKPAPAPDPAPDLTAAPEVYAPLDDAPLDIELPPPEPAPLPRRRVPRALGGLLATVLLMLVLPLAVLHIVLEAITRGTNACGEAMVGLIERIYPERGA